MEVLAADQVEGVEIAGGRIALLGTGDIEPDDPGVAPADRAFGDLDRARGLAHRGHDRAHDDGMAGGGGPRLPDRVAREDRLLDLVERQAALGAQLRGHADLGVDDAVGGEVLGALGRDPGDRVALLHDAGRVVERLEVELERLAVGAAAEPRRQLVDVGGRQAVVAELGGEVDHRRGAQAAVEVVVEERLRGARDGVGCQHPWSSPARLARMVPSQAIDREARGAMTLEPRFGLFMSQANKPWSQVRDEFALADDLGFDHAWLVDHLLDTDGPPDLPCLEAWTLLAAIARETSRVRIGTLVTSNTYRHPSILLKEAVTVDHLSDGRLILGLGAGWQVDEHRRYGIPLPPPGERVDRLEEAIQIALLLMSGEPATLRRAATTGSTTRGSSRGPSSGRGSRCWSRPTGRG